MDLFEELSLRAVSEKAFISITGGGGKTTMLIGLASHLRSRGRKVLMTTTTKVASPDMVDYRADRIFSDHSVLSHFPEAPCNVFFALESGLDGKWIAPSYDVLDKLLCRYDVIVCEADGSRHLPLKIHTSRDPQIPPFCTYTISIMGLWGIGKDSLEVSFGEGRKAVVDRDYLNDYINSPEGLLKGSIKDHRAIVFNGADEYSDSSLLKSLYYPSDVFVCTASEREGVLYEIIQ